MNLFIFIISNILYPNYKTNTSQSITMSYTSVGYSYGATSSVSRNPNSFVSPVGKPSNLGGGYNGYSPALLGGGAGTHGGSGMEGGNERSMDRLLLRQAWNGQYASGVVNGRKPVCTPVRRVNNAGDYLGRQNYVSEGRTKCRAWCAALLQGRGRCLRGTCRPPTTARAFPRPRAT